MKELPRNEILVGDAKERLEELPDSSVDMAMTSPPYWGLRDYGVAGQLGLESSPEEYVENLMQVFDELKRVLKPTGVFFLNIDDTYSRGSRPKDATEDTLRKQSGGEAGEPDYDIEYDLSDKCMSMVPERVVMAMVDRGWILRNKVVWRKKGGGMPESVTDRFSTTWEYVYMFSLNQDYFFDLDAVREPHAEVSKNRVKKGWNPNKEHPTVSNDAEDMGRWVNDNGKNPGDMWTIATAQMSEAHFAVYPEELVEKPVKAGCPPKVCSQCGTPYERDMEEVEMDLEDLSQDKREAIKRAGADSSGNYFGEGKEDETGMAETPSESKRSMLKSMKTEKHMKGWDKKCKCDTDRTEKGVVLDPFAGAGTTLLVARKHNRDYIGIELNEEYAEMAAERIKEEVGGVPLDQFL